MRGDGEPAERLYGKGGDFLRDSAVLDCLVRSEAVL